MLSLIISCTLECKQQFLYIFDHGKVPLPSSNSLEIKLNRTEKVEYSHYHTHRLIEIHGHHIHIKNQVGKQTHLLSALAIASKITHKIKPAQHYMKIGNLSE